MEPDCACPVVALKVSDIDSKRMVIRIEQGKGHKDAEHAFAASARAVARLANGTSTGLAVSRNEPGQPDVSPPAQARLRYRSGVARSAGVPAHPATQLCDASSGAKHRYQGDPGLVGTYEKLDTTALYARVATKTIREIVSPFDRVQPSSGRAPNRPPEARRVSRPSLEVADIFRRHGPAWRRTNASRVSLGQLKVMSAIENCRTAALGGHVARCERAHWRRSRTIVAATGTCPNARARQQRTGWQRARPTCCRCRTIMSCSRCRRLLPTSPTRTRPSSTISCLRHLPGLITIAGAAKHLGARVGITSVLHAGAPP